MRENVRNENNAVGTDNNNPNTNHTTQQIESAELNTTNSQGMIYLDIIQPFAL